MNLIQKLIEIRKAIPYLQKENKGFQYNFVSSSQTLVAVRNKMNEIGVMLVPHITAHNVTEKTTQKGGSMYFTELDIEFTWHNADDPKDTLVIPWYGQGVDDAEKGVGKALTYAEKYLMLKTFNIPTDKDDPDYFQQKHSDEPAAKPKGRAKQAESAAPAISTDDAKEIARICTEVYNIDKKDIINLVVDMIGHGITKATDMTQAEGAMVITLLKAPDKAHSFVEKYLPKKDKEAA